MEPVEIVLIDDSKTDAMLIQRFAKMAKITNPIRHFESGEEGLAYLESDSQLPGLVLLDINMPGMNGYDVLRAIKGHDDPNIKALPVVFLTTGDNPREVVRAYRDHVNSYAVKPTDMDGFHQLLQGLSQYWFQLVKIPGEG